MSIVFFGCTGRLLIYIVGVVIITSLTLTLFKSNTPCHQNTLSSKHPVNTPYHQVKFVAPPNDQEELRRDLSFMYNTWLPNALASGDLVPSPRVQKAPNGLRGIQAGYPHSQPLWSHTGTTTPMHYHTISPTLVLH